MRNILITAGIMAGLGTFMAQMADRFTPSPASATSSAAVATANGTIKAARMRLPMIEVGGLVVRDVDAMVLPDRALSENLLGLSFLSKLRRFEYANGQLVLEQ